MLKEFKPSLIFLAKFLGIYFFGNILYGLYVESYSPHADGITRFVTQQTSFLLNIIGTGTSVKPNDYTASVFLMEGNHAWLSVYEGCNGLNIMIIFLAFIIAFGGPKEKITWFIPMGLLVIHFSNLLRISLLYFTIKDFSAYFYYVHKYFFTAILYLIIFLLWALWVLRFNGKPRDASH